MNKVLRAELIEQRIFIIRKQRVMLNTHIAELYGIETRTLMQAVKRNVDRFPDDFMFELTRDEIQRISQIVTSLKYSKVVFVFTEQGISMLSSVVNTPRAVQINIAIMRTFVKVREFLYAHKDLAKRLEDLERKYESHDHQIKAVFDAIRQMMEPNGKKKRYKVGF
jgi:hypothetical protein